MMTPADKVYATCLKKYMLSPSVSKRLQMRR
jgi:hypothetical protein